MQTTTIGRMYKWTPTSFRQASPKITETVGKKFPPAPWQGCGVSSLGQACRDCGDRPLWWRLLKDIQKGRQNQLGPCPCPSMLCPTLRLLEGGQPYCSATTGPPLHPSWLPFIPGVCQSPWTTFGEHYNLLCRSHLLRAVLRMCVETVPLHPWWELSVKETDCL